MTVPKQIRLSTALLLIAVIALAIALYTQQKQHRANLISERENGRLEGMFFADDMLVNRVLMSKPERFDAWSRTKVVTLIRDLWKHEHRYESFKKHHPGPTAIEMARRALYCAKIDSHEKLIDYALSHTFYNPHSAEDASYLDGEGIPANLPELHDSSSEEYASFKRFVERAIN